MLKSLELDGEEQSDMVMPIPMDDAPDFPYGMRICLTQAEMEKLGIDPSEATVGASFLMHAMCRITSVSASESDGGSSFRMEAQIEQADVDGTDEPDADDAPAPAPGKIAYKSMTG